MKESSLVPSDFIKDLDVLKFFTDDIHNINTYEPGHIKNKPDVLNPLPEIQQSREIMMRENQKKQNETTNNMRLQEMSVQLQQLTIENRTLVDKVKNLESKLRQLIGERVQEQQKERRIALSPNGPTVR